MMKRNDRMRFLSLLLVMMLVISSAAFGEKSDVKAASMWLVKTEGSVAVTDDAGEAVSLLDRLGLFSGYGVNTEAESYGWIDLDETKLTKMNENSDVTVEKDGKKLTLTVNSGGLFFNVTEPLADDETMEIRTSTMVTGIRGTMGWVTQDAVCLLEGTVTVTAGDQSVTVSAGEMAYLSEDGKLDVQAFNEEDIPAYVSVELENGSDLTASIDTAQGEPEDQPNTAYDEYLSGLQDVVYSEVIDFEDDGVPELLVISGTLFDDPEYPGDHGYLLVDICREDADGTVQVVGDYTLHAGTHSSYSLVEADGRKYLRLYSEYRADGDIEISCLYFGSMEGADERLEDYIMIESYDGYGREGGDQSYSINEYSNNEEYEGQLYPSYEGHSADKSKVEALENKYTLLRELVSTEGSNITVEG